MLNINQISEKLSSFAIVERAKKEKFTLRSGGKIQAIDFIRCFFIMIQKGQNTLKAWAETISFIMDDKTTISDVAINHKLQFRHIGFFVSLLGDVINEQIFKRTPKNLETKLLKPFSRVFLEDSTCLKLPSNLADYFKGPHSNGKTGKAATARIQFRTDLKQGTTSHITLQSYRDNDQKFSGAILDDLKANDLVIRDLGYWSLKVFKCIIKKGAYLLTRYFPSSYLFEKDGQQINLIDLIRTANKQAKAFIDLQVLVGAEDKVPLRLIMIKVPEKVAAERRRKANRNRDKRVKYTQSYMELLGWVILLTNVDSSVWKAEDVLKVYGYRWRIETIFKCWKSHFNFQKLFANKQSLTPARVEITIYLLLIWITLFFNRLFIYYERIIFERKKEFISLVKFAEFIMRWFSQFCNTDELEKYIDKVWYYCRYDKQNDRENFSQLLYYKNLT